MLGYSPAEMIGKAMHDLVYSKNKNGEPCPPEQCSVLRSLRTGVGCRVGNDFFWGKDGTAIPVNIPHNRSSRTASLRGSS